ncbi:MAG: hypothetical protein EOO46_19035 [Flavobacterium sp.]|nr:MAG: hypothetical protein EOO46_19035 [Flavobacterium sp.]
MKSILLSFLLLFLITTFSFGQKKTLSGQSTTHWLTPEKMTPLSFLHTMKIKGNQANHFAVLTMVDSFPKDWLTKKDIDTLVKLVNVKEKCSCFLNPLSSYIPTNDSAELGGYAIRLIKAYKEKRKVSFGLYACPKIEKGEGDALIRWWATQPK